MFRSVVRRAPYQWHNWNRPIVNNQALLGAIHFNPTDCKERRYASTTSNFDGAAINIRSIADIDLKKYPLEKYMHDTSVKTVQNLGVTAATCAGTVIVAPLLAPMVTPAILIGGWFGSFGLGIYSCFKVADGQPQISEKIGVNKNEIEIVDNYDRKKWANILFATQGVIIAPLVAMTLDVVPMALVGTGAIMAGTITTALYLPKGNLIPLYPAMYCSLWGLIGMGFLSLWFPVLHMPEAYLGIGLFSLLNMVDTQMMIEAHEHKRIDPLAHSINLGLNTINIFVRLLEILSKLKKN
jgi:FtsH-binding integral membrane protein